MKNKGLIYLLLAGGVILLLSMKKAKGYTIDVPAPEKISEEQFNKPSLLKKVSKVVKKAAPVVKKFIATAKQKKALKKTASVLSKGVLLRGVGNFPTTC